MSDPQPSPNLSVWAREHLQRYLASDGADGHYWRHATLPDMKPMPALLLTTTGRRSGQQYINPLYYGETEGGYFIIASNMGSDRHPGWYLNVVAHPEVRLQVGAKKFAARARVAVGEERQRLYDQMANRHAAYDGYRKKAAREIPVVVLEPVDPS